MEKHKYDELVEYYVNGKPFEVDGSKHRKVKEEKVKVPSDELEKKVWRAPGELRDMIFADLGVEDLKRRLLAAVRGEHSVASDLSTAQYQALKEYFLSLIYKHVTSCLYPDDEAKFDALIQRYKPWNFYLIRSVLFDGWYSTNENLLEPLLNKFSFKCPTLRVAFFTRPSKIGYETLLALQHFYERNMESLETIVVPTYSQDTRPVETTGEYELAISLQRKAMADTGTPGCHATKLDVLAHRWVPAYLLRDLIALYNGYRVRGVINHRQTLATIGPIIADLGWSKQIFPEELRFSFADLAQYGKKMSSNKAEERPQDFSLGSLELLQLYDCDRNSEFMDGLRSYTINIETFLFSVHDRDLTKKEEESLVNLVRSASKLEALSLSYTPPPIQLAPLPKPEFWIESDVTNDADMDRSDSRTDETRQLPPTHSALHKQGKYLCRFPLAKLLGPRNESLRSLSLTQRLCKMSSEDLTYISTAAPFLRDLVINFPALEDAIGDLIFYPGLIRCSSSYQAKA